MSEVFGSLFGFAAMGLVVFLIYQLFALVGDMARARGHDPWAWWLISICWSPFGSIIVMWLFFPRIEEGR